MRFEVSSVPLFIGGYRVVAFGRLDIDFGLKEFVLIEEALVKELDIQDRLFPAFKYY